MKNFARPMILTILFGIVCSLAFMPLMELLDRFIAWRFAFRLLIWGYLVSYTMLLAFWKSVRARLLVFPLGILFGMIVLERSHTVFLLLCLGILAWIRSSVCLPRSIVMMLAIEAMLGLGGGSLVFQLNPQTNLAWALGIWLFFLIQSLYFLMGRQPEESEYEDEADDLFERAYRDAEKLLAG